MLFVIVLQLWFQICQDIRGGLELNGMCQLQINTGPVTIQNKNKNATTRNTEGQLNDCF
jgi:hypothetical protein